jgi:hypothetical protein
MPGKSPFGDDWRDCLQAHYTHVIRNNDQRTEKTLRTVLHECGYDDSDLNQWYLLATMRADDMPPDYQPDRERAEAVAAPEVAPAVELPTAAEVPPPEEDAPPPDPAGFQQLSLF